MNSKAREGEVYVIAHLYIHACIRHRTKPGAVGLNGHNLLKVVADSYINIEVKLKKSKPRKVRFFYYFVYFM